MYNFGHVNAVGKTTKSILANAYTSFSILICRNETAFPPFFFNKLLIIFLTINANYVFRFI